MTVRRVFVWALRAWFLLAVAGFLLGPPAVVYGLFGWRWAALAAIVTVGAIVFLVLFGPWLASKPIKGLIKSNIDGVLADMRWQEQISNHARFEGTWTPHEVGLAVAGRELARYERAELNHAAAEGAYVRPPLHATEL
jgi:hypothetical protein